MDYQRVSCGVFDRYESLAVSKKIVKIKYLNEDQTSKEVQGFIKNIFSKDGAEFLLINSVEIRLDKIQSVEEL